MQGQFRERIASVLGFALTPTPLPGRRGEPEGWSFNEIPGFFGLLAMNDRLFQVITLGSWAYAGFSRAFVCRLAQTL